MWKGGQNLGQPFCAVDKMCLPFGFEPPRRGADPLPQGRGFAQGGLSPRIAGLNRGGAVEIGRIGQNVVKLSLAQMQGHVGQIGLDHL